MKLPTLFVVATIPAAVSGMLVLGRSIDPAALSDAAYWQFFALGKLPPGWPRSILLGLSFFLPLLLVSVVVSRVWAGIFARVRGHPVDDSWLMSGWLFALALPAGMSPAYAALGLSFGLVFGSYVFGGPGRNAVPPLALALVFLQVSYPALFDPGQWIPGQAVGSTWDALHAAPDALAASSPLALAVGQTAAFGAASPLACLVGLGALLYRRVAAPAIVLGGLGAAVLVGLAFDGAGGLVHPVVGAFMFALAFVATDPALKPVSGPGRWLYGAAFGALTVILRAADASGPEGTWQALLLASLAAPLLDRIGPWSTRAAQLGSGSTGGREDA